MSNLDAIWAQKAINCMLYFVCCKRYVAVSESSMECVYNN